MIDLKKKQALHVDQNAIQQISFTANLDRAENTETFFFFEEVKETILGFSQKALQKYFINLFCFDIISASNFNI